MDSYDENFNFDPLPYGTGMRRNITAPLSEDVNVLFSCVKTASPDDVRPATAPSREGKNGARQLAKGCFRRLATLLKKFFKIGKKKKQTPDLSAFSVTDLPPHVSGLALKVDYSSGEVITPSSHET